MRGLREGNKDIHLLGKRSRRNIKSASENQSNPDQSQQVGLQEQGNGDISKEAEKNKMLTIPKGVVKDCAVKIVRIQDPQNNAVYTPAKRTRRTKSTPAIDNDMNGSQSKRFRAMNPDDDHDMSKIIALNCKLTNEVLGLKKMLLERNEEFVQMQKNYYESSIENIALKSSLEEAKKNIEDLNELVETLRAERFCGDLIQFDDDCEIDASATGTEKGSNTIGPNKDIAAGNIFAGIHVENANDTDMESDSNERFEAQDKTDPIEPNKEIAPENIFAGIVVENASGTDMESDSNERGEEQDKSVSIEPNKDIAADNIVAETHVENASGTDMERDSNGRGEEQDKTVPIEPNEEIAPENGVVKQHNQQYWTPIE